MKKYPILLAAILTGNLLATLSFADDQVAAIAQGQPQSTQVSEQTKVSIRQDIARLKTQLEDFRKNRASLQKQYLTMRALLIDYSLVGEAQSPEALALNKEADHLQQTYPQVLNHGISINPPAPEKKKPFSPRDIHVMGIWGSGHKVAIKYQYRIEFYTLPDDVFFIQTEGRSFVVRRSNSGENEISVSSLKLKPVSKLTFQRPVDIVPRWPRTVEKNILVCTSMLNGFYPVTDEEKNGLPSREREYIEWNDANGELGDFCGVVTIEGKTIWELKYKQSLPDHLLSPVAMRPDGLRALILSGGRVSGGEGSDSVGNARDLYIWEYPDQVKKVRAKGYGNDANALFLKFSTGQL